MKQNWSAPRKSLVLMVSNAALNENIFFANFFKFKPTLLQRRGRIKGNVKPCTGSATRSTYIDIIKLYAPGLQMTCCGAIKRQVNDFFRPRQVWHQYFDSGRMEDSTELNGNRQCYRWVGMHTRACASSKCATRCCRYLVIFTKLKSINLCWYLNPDV